MVLNQEFDAIAVLRLDSKTGQDRICNAATRHDMALILNSFAEIVQQQGKIQQLRLFYFGENLGKTPIPFRSRVLKTMQGVNGKKRMLVNRVAMKKVAHDEDVNQLE